MLIIVDLGPFAVQTQPAFVTKSAQPLFFYELARNSNINKIGGDPPSPQRNTYIERTPELKES